MSYDPKPRHWVVKLLLLSPVFLLGMFFALQFSVALHMTNETDFCTSCHSMQINLKEYKKTVHYQNHSGVRAICSDCHVPKAFLPKMVAKVMAAKDVYHELLGTLNTKEKYEKHRWDMARRVWAKMRATDSRECRSCHSWDAMKYGVRDEDDDVRPQGKRARKRHQRAQKQGKTCIDCHQGIAHEEPEEPEESEGREQHVSSLQSSSPAGSRRKGL